MDSANVRQSEVRTLDGEREVLYSVSSLSDNVTIMLGSVTRFARIAGDRLLSPMEVKVDIAIRGWTYERSDSRLAVPVEISGTSPPRTDETSDDESAGWATAEASVTVASGPHSLVFAWDKTATVENVSRTAEVASVEPTGLGARAYRRTREQSLRVLTAAFAVFFVKGIALTAYLFLGLRDLTTLFLLVGGFDVLILALFYVFTLRR